MFNSHYRFVKLGTTPNQLRLEGGNLLCTYRYKFKTSDGIYYIVEVTQYESSLYMIEFYLREDKDNKTSYKYGRLTNQGNAFKIISTCFEIMSLHLQQDELASFAFIGSPGIANNIEEPMSCTQRFRIYRYAAINWFKEEEFEQTEDADRSAYLILNNKVDKQVLKLKANEILSALF